MKKIAALANRGETAMEKRLAGKYDVGGVLLDRPFKIRRLGHFGFNVSDLEAGRRFYFDLLGFFITEPAGAGWFGRHAGDHHSFALFDKKRFNERQYAGANARHFRPENDINQITWQVQSVAEMVAAGEYFRQLGVEVIREGRAGAGSQLHLYVWAPDDQIFELYYGIEQIGWDGYARPVAMRHGTPKAPTEPEPPDYEVVRRDIEKGIDLRQGWRYANPLPNKYAVDGLLLPQPFKIVRVGPVKLFVDDYEAAKHWYEQIAGFTLTEEVEWQGERCAFLRCANEHHSLGLFPKSWRRKLGLSEQTSSMSFGLQLANYRQLHDAVKFLRENGVRVETDVVPPELHPGIDYAAYAFDPDGHLIELYYYMEQVGWDGRPCPKQLRRKVDPKNWPETLEPLADTYTGEPFLGPWA
ncbi:MAG TPA: VOC family protein [Candidatus Acidoferrales bacterium]|nr:VOC family protein [Candidatus Acidoferrales bacterium]